MTITTKERPFDCTGDEVRAIRDGRMTMFRRPMEPQPPTRYIERYVERGWLWSRSTSGQGAEQQDLWTIPPCPFGKPGDRLWVRESGTLLSFAAWNDPRTGRDVWDNCGWRYADGSETYLPVVDDPYYDAETPCSSSQMPRWASRDTLELTDVRVERLQEITEEDAYDEGTEGWATEYIKRTGTDKFCCIRHAFGALWDSRYAKPRLVRSGGLITHYVSYPWEDVQEIREHRGKEWRVLGNPWVFVNTFRRVEG